MIARIRFKNGTEVTWGDDGRWQGEPVQADLLNMLTELVRYHYSPANGHPRAFIWREVLEAAGDAVAESELFWQEPEGVPGRIY